MSKKKLSLKDLILFLVGFLGVSITALGIGFFVLPLVLDSPESETVVQEMEKPSQSPPVEKAVEPKEEKISPPNVFLSTQKGTISVDCGSGNTGEGKKVELFLEKPQTCSISSDSTTAKVKLNPDERYYCFFDYDSSCRTEQEYQEVQAEKAKKKVTASKPVAKKEAKKTSRSKNLKNEAEIIVTGPATLTVSADSDAIIFVDGKKIRKAPLFKYDVSPGSHKVDIVSQVDFKKRKTFTLQTESGMNYIRQWSFQDNTWLKKIP